MRRYRAMRALAIWDLLLMIVMLVEWLRRHDDLFLVIAGVCFVAMFVAYLAADTAREEARR